MRILVAMDSFKGSLSSKKAGEAISTGIRKVLPDASITVVSIADGGEGTVAAFVSGCGGRIVNVTVSGPLGAPVDAYYAILPDGTAVIEMAAASGLMLISADERNPLTTSTWGTGELIKNALDQGARIILLGIGGSATNDGGSGMAQALGARLIDGNGNDLPPGGGTLNNLETIDLGGLDPRLASTEIIVLCDVDNPLSGEQGASAIYGPQKGATPEMVKVLDRNLSHYAEVLEKHLGRNLRDLPGAGAAGGLGAGLIAFAGARLESGIQTVLDTLNIEKLVQHVDLVITGEGRIDSQSLRNKAPIGVARVARQFSTPVIAFVGSLGEGSELAYDCGISAIIPIVEGPMALEEALQKGAELLEKSAERSFRLINLGASLRQLTSSQ